MVLNKFKASQFYSFLLKNQVSFIDIFILSFNVKIVYASYKLNSLDHILIKLSNN